LTVDSLNRLSMRDAAAAFHSCCGSTRWIDAMLRSRPFDSADDVMAAADKAWEDTEPADWHEAFAHHPRIGEKKSAAEQSAIASGWSSEEQAGAAGAGEELARMNKQYEERFGHIYIVCASGRSAAEMLDMARRRMSNDRETELRVAAGEQHKITRLRLAKLLGETR
jgi:OHCU decarboxylase